MLQKYIIERDIPKVGTFERDQLRDAAKTSNAALAKLSPDVQWVKSYVAEDKTFCVCIYWRRASAPFNGTRKSVDSPLRRSPRLSE